MTTEHDALRTFQEAYLDYLEGERDTPPPLDGLAGEQRRAAEAFVETIRAARGIDPYASRPPLEELLKSGFEPSAASRDLGKGLEEHLRQTVDPGSVVTVDAASAAAGLDSELVIQARGMRMRVVEETGSDDLGDALVRRADDIARVFRAFPDCHAVLYTTSGEGPRGVVLARGDVHVAIETPTGDTHSARLPRSVEAAATACEVWLKGLIPEFEPLGTDLFESATGSGLSLDAVELASEVVAEVSASGGRAKIEAKRETWSEFGDREIQHLATIVEEASSGGLSAEKYASRVDQLSEMAA